MRLLPNFKGILVIKTFSASSKCLSTQTTNQPVQTMDEMKTKLHAIVGAQRGFKQLLVDRIPLLKMLPKTQDELPVRNMNDSFDHAIIPLSTDLDLQDRYSTRRGFVRRGRLMEDMDIFAVWCAFKHICNPKDEPGSPSPYVLVTALVDQMAFTPIVPQPDADIRLSGHVTWVGKSSLEVTVWLEQQYRDAWRKLTRSFFLMAARNSTNTGSAVVNKLEATTPEEEAILKGGLDRKKYRTMLQESNLLNMVPDATEQQIIHKLFLKTVKENDKTLSSRVLPANSRWMKDTKMTTVISSHPENRNMHNTVFGGFLMRQAMELSWNCCFMHCNVRPQLVYSGDIMFHRPIEVGSLIKMIARVVYTEGEYVQITTHAEVHDVYTKTIETTNEFHYTYRTPKKVEHVSPKTYSEAMMYLDGRRHFAQAMGLSYERNPEA